MTQEPRPTCKTCRWSITRTEEGWVPLMAPPYTEPITTERIFCCYDPDERQKQMDSFCRFHASLRRESLPTPVPATGTPITPEELEQKGC